MKTMYSIIITLLIFIAGLVTDNVQGYKVTITLNPPTGPYRIGNTIRCSCFVDPIPDPPEPVTYRWDIPQHLFGSFVSHGQNTSFTPDYYSNLHFMWMYCKVSSNSTLVAEGRKLINVHGFIYPLGDLVRMFTTGETVLLQINISTEYSRARYIQNLTWYHNGSQICSRRTRNNGTELVLPNMGSNDAGIYQVKVTSLSFRRPDCDSRLLPHLESLAIIAPVTFVLTQGDEHTYNPERFLPTERIYISANESADVMFSSEHCFDENTTQELLSYNEKQWFHNGRSISVTNNFKYNSSLHFRPNSPVKSTFVVTDVSRSDLGDYLGIISTNTYDMLSWCTEYLSFIPYFYWRFLFGSQSFPVTVMYSSVQLYEPPSVILSSSLRAAITGQAVDLSCLAVDGNPNVHNITLFKNNSVLATVVESDSLVYRIRNSYGMYTCLVKSVLSTTTTSFLLQEKANFQALLVIKSTSCHQFLELNGSGMLATRISIEINETVQNLCGCLASTELTSLWCTSTQLLSLNGTLTYSDESGQVTATRVVAMLQEWILNTNDAAIDIDGSALELRLSKFCVARTTSLLASSNTRINGLITGSFAGGLITGVFMTLLIISTVICVLRVRAMIQMSQSRPETSYKEEEVEMGSNQAYESVTIRHTRSSESQLHQGSTTYREEPVYELPPTT